METVLLRHLQELSISIDPSAMRVVPSSFDPHDPDLCAIPRPLTVSWNSYERALRKADSRTVLVRIPLFWQIESALRHACESAEVTICINEEANMPIGARAISSAGTHIVLTTAQDAQQFARYLIDTQKPLPSAWHLIHRMDRPWHTPDALRGSHARISQEVHLAPGISLLEQCDALGDRGEQLYHITELFSYHNADRTYISSASGDPLALTNLQLPFLLSERSACDCGKTILERV
jgi:hypothetical protein